MKFFPLDVHRLNPIPFLNCFSGFIIQTRSGIMIPLESAPYQSCYCEENVFKLLELCDDRDGLFAVIVSNDDKAVTLWCQKSAPTEMYESVY